MKSDMLVPSSGTALSSRGSTEVAPQGSGMGGGALSPLTLDAVSASRTDSFRRLGRNMRNTVAVILAFTGALGALLFKTVIAGAVVGQGTLVVETGPKAVQHQQGGVVRELLVENGDMVHAGQPLVVLDQVVADAQLRAATSSLLQKEARLDRLIAERDGLDELTFPSVSQDLLALQPAYEQFLDVERRQFELRRENRQSEREQLQERIKQIEEQMNGEAAQMAALDQEIGIIGEEVEGLRALFKRKLVNYERLSDIERSLSQLQGRRADLSATTAANKGRISEIKLQILQIDQTLRAELTDQIAQTQQEVSEFAERRVIAQEAKDRSVIVAPQDGTVHELAVHTVGGVVQPAETIMVVVPQADALVGEVRIRPTDIDQIYPGQDAEIHFSAFDRGTTPVIRGTLSRVSPDLETDKRTGAPYYQARISVGPEELARLGDLHLVPGMPLEVFIHTSDRTIISYLSKPLTDQMNRAFR
ncbi:HlyD family type I secretion periplasmic adaptor subunit [Antarcticirhabdus aurantiaca]|uniref:HlyD family type I secretion periplasmic adaptor subunit n=1 Tax=Antarcticirhabdus aurantiaca TaxID=2606717 RepID=A0ACD4NR90_9HYPH|nr:HlyD family type I secretion periplasmic adaptor subunit [Antarcticirhabdus aurantiaca]WAJ29180.1 HlyD family type I secretion periplasmic adaptor subunit [Jeongeuplla avenae]